MTRAEKSLLLEAAYLKMGDEGRGILDEVVQKLAEKQGGKEESEFIGCLKKRKTTKKGVLR